MTQLAEVLPRVLEQPWARALGWALIYSLFQGLVVIALVAGSLALLRRASPQARYALACGGLLVMLLLPAFTWWSLYRNELRPKPVFTAVSALKPESARTVHSSAVDPPAPPEAVGYQGFFRATSSAWRVDEAAPVLVAAWLVGVAALAFWRTGGLIYAVWLCRRGTRPAAPAFQTRLARLRYRLRIGRPVALLESFQVRVPVVIGWLRPVVLVPVGVITGLSVTQLDAIIAHELVHIRRWDYLVNLLQTTVENLLFYHPAVWWLSHRIRVEREYCCDDAAAACCTSTRAYAEALAALESWAGARPLLGMAAIGGSLLDRVRRQLATRSASHAGGWGWVLALPALILMAGLLGLPGSGYGVARDRGEIVQYTFDRGPGVQTGPMLRVRGAVPTEDRFGSPDAAYRFDGGNAVVEMEEAMQGDFLTIAFWARSEVPISADSPRGYTVMGSCLLAPDNNSGVNFGSYTAALDNEVLTLFWEGAGKASYWTTSTFPTGIDTQWHHYAFVWDSHEGAYVLFVDGAGLGLPDVVIWNNCTTEAPATSPVPTWISERRWQFGRIGNAMDSGWLGSVDGVVIWDRSLFATEAEALCRARDGDERAVLVAQSGGQGGDDEQDAVERDGLPARRTAAAPAVRPEATDGSGLSIALRSASVPMVHEVLTLLNSSPRTTHYELTTTGYGYAVEPRQCDLMSRQRQVLRLTGPEAGGDVRRVYLTAELARGPFSPEISLPDTVETYSGTVAYTAFRSPGVKYTLMTVERDSPRVAAVRAYVRKTAVAGEGSEGIGNMMSD